MTRYRHRIDVASLAASILCLLCVTGCGEEPEAPRDPSPAVRATSISGRVEDMAGTAVGAAMIFVAEEATAGTSDEEPLEMRRTLIGASNADGRYVVPLAGATDRDRSVWLRAEHPDFPFSGEVREPLLVEAGVGALPGPTLRLLRAGALKGRVEDSGGAGLPGVDVILRSPHVRTGFRAQSGIDGLFAFAAVPEGPVRVRLATRGADELELDVVADGEVVAPDSLVADPEKGDG